MSDELKTFSAISFVVGSAGLIWGDGERGVVLIGIIVLVYLLPISFVLQAAFEKYGRP
ncbi:MAG: hypothetical protein V4674_00720 [Patescibacteria group bacterium]